MHVMPSIVEDQRAHAYLTQQMQRMHNYIMQDINFWGNVYPTHAALPYLRRSHGRVVVNASVESWLPMPRMSLYSVS